MTQTAHQKRPSPGILPNAGYKLARMPAGNPNDGDVLVVDDASGSIIVLAWSAPTGGGGGGDVIGPSSATNNAIARFDTTTGKLLQNSSATVDDGGIISASKLIAQSTAANTLNVVVCGENLDAGSAAGSVFETRLLRSGTSQSFGYCGFRKWPTSANFGEFVVCVGSYGVTSTTPVMTLNINGLLTVPIVAATATISAGVNTIGMHYSASGIAPTASVIRHGLWAKDSSDLYFQTSGATRAVLSWDARFGAGYTDRSQFTATLASNGPLGIRGYTIASLPAAASNAGNFAVVSDSSPANLLVQASGGAWRYVHDNSAV